MLRLTWLCGLKRVDETRLTVLTPGRARCSAKSESGHVKGTATTPTFGGNDESPTPFKLLQLPNTTLCNIFSPSCERASAFCRADVQIKFTGSADPHPNLDLPPATPFCYCPSSPTCPARIADSPGT